MSLPLSAGTAAVARAARPRVPVFQTRGFLALLFILPAAVLLLGLLAYPLGLGLWLGLTDASIGDPGHFTGLANFVSLARDSVFRLVVFNTLFYTCVATAVKLPLGLYLAMLLNRRMRFKSILRAVILLPFVVPTVLSAVAFWWIFDSQFSIISWALVKLGVIHDYIDFLGTPWNARWTVIAVNVWRGTPFVAITLLAGLQTVPPSLQEAAMLDGATAWHRFRYITLPLLLPIIAVVMTFSVLMTFADFQLIYSITRGGPINATHLMATLSYERAITGGHFGEGAAIADAMVPFLAGAIMISFFGLRQRRERPAV